MSGNSDGENRTGSDRTTVQTRWEVPEETQAVANQLSEGLDADVIFYNGPIDEPYDHRFIEACANRKKRENVLLVLVTDGGSLDSAFRIASWLQGAYEEFTIYITGRCKSAGTLIAVGADDLIMSEDHGELGPLDIQMKDPEDSSGWRSGLDYSNTLLTLDNQAFHAYEKFRRDILRRDGNAVPREYAMKIASEMSIGFYQQVYGQLDAMSIGQASRALNIASEYGTRLLRYGGNSDRSRLNRLISGYPSHEFAIDYEETTHLFYNVYRPNDPEYELEVALGEYAINPHWPSEQEWDGFTPFRFPSAEPAEDEGEK